jgi:methionyl-tRNA formyltransferase
MLADARPIGFKTDAVVPARILRRLGYGAYNFHPGPPEYPGWAPFTFAIDDQAPTFGVTAHKMTNKVDAGPIVGVARFPIPPNIRSTQLQLEAIKTMSVLLGRLAPSLVNDSKPPPVLPLSWGKPVRTRTESNRMRELSADLDEEERDRHRRAFLL